MAQDRAIFTMAGRIWSIERRHFQRPSVPISRSHRYMTLNVRETVRDADSFSGILIGATLYSRVSFRMYFSDLYLAPEYLSTYCQPVSGVSGRHHLRSADRGHLDFPRVKLASYGGRSFAYAGPSNWNSVPAYLRDSSLSLSSFKHHLKTFLLFLLG